MKRSFLVLGGAGAMGRVTVRDLFESHPRNRIVIADYDRAAARAYATSFHSARVSASFADARKPAELARLLRAIPVLINCTQHDFNLSVMQAALHAGSHYLDLGGLFTWTRRQLKLHDTFRRAGLMAILGVGGSPGITNVMARDAADRLERISSIKIRSGWVDFNPPVSGISFGFSAQTIIEELTLPAWIYSAGKFRTIAPRSRWERVKFAAPVGICACVCVRHSEVATLPGAFRNKGIRSCDFKLGYDRAFVREIVLRLRNGWTVADFRKLPVSRETVNDGEILRVVVRGKRAAARASTTLVVDCESRALPAWKASAGDINTGCPPSIVAQMLVDGRIPRLPGVWGPERVIPPQPFFEELETRGMRIVRRKVAQASSL